MMKNLCVERRWLLWSTMCLIAVSLFGGMGWFATPADAAILIDYNSSHKYRQIAFGGATPAGWNTLAFDDASWGTGQAAFGVAGCSIPIRTTWNLNTDLLVRTKVNLPNGATGMVIRILVDNDIVGVYFNGTLISGPRTHDGCPAYNDFNFNVPDNLVVLGQNVIAFHVRDRGGSAAFDARIDGNPKTNRNPVLTGPATVNTNENQATTFTLNASDPDGHTLTWTIPTLPAGATVSGTGNSRTFNWTPNFTQSGTYNLTFAVTDNGSPNLVTQHTVSVVVANVNRPPTISGTNSFTVDEGNALNFTVSASDPDGDTLTWTTNTLPTGASVTGSGNSRAFAWTPNFTQAGTYSVVFTVRDPGNLSASLTVSITVRNVNRPPSITSTAPTVATENQLYSYSAQATDPDVGDTLTWSLTTQPPGAAVSNSGVVTWTPGDADAEKTFNFVLRVCDAANACVTQSWSVKVNNVNDPPVITGTPATSATEDQPYSFSPGVSDPDPGDSHTWKKIQGPAGATVDPATGKVTWTPGDAEAGKTVTFEIEVCDKANVCARETWTVAVTNVNDPPQITGNPPTVAVEKQTYTYKVPLTDPDPGDTHTWTLVQKPTGATIDSNGNISWTPGTADAGKTYTFEVRVCDKANACATKTWTVTVTNVNDPPVITGVGPSTATENVAYSPTMTATDPDPGDTLTWTLTGGPTGATIDPNTGKISWTPGDADAGQTFTFTVRVCDKANACVTRSWTVTVTNVNDPPTITGTPSTQATEDQLYTFSPGVTDPDPGDSHTWKKNQGPSGATVDPATGKVSWTPGDADAGKTYDFEMQVCDKANVCNTKAWKVTVTNVNDPPTISGNPPTTAIEDQAYSYSPSASDPDPNDELNWKLKKGPTGATIDPKTGKVSWTPGDADAEQTYDFEIEVCDKIGACVTQTWKVKVANVNDPPTITGTPDPNATEKQNYTYSPGVTDPDPGETHTWNLKQGPTGFTIDPKTGQVSWTPGTADAGKTYDIEIEVCDKAGSCVQQRWKVTVTNVNDPPVITGTPPTQATEDQTYTYKPGVTDPDPGDSHTWTLKKGPSGATVDPNTGEVSWKPGDTDAGKTYDFEIEVCDKAGSCVSQSWKVAVTNVNDPPKIVGTPPIRGYVSEKLAYQPTVQDADPADTHTWTLKKGPVGAVINSSTGEVTWTPGVSDAQKKHDFEIEVCDSGTPPLCDTQTFTLEVEQRCKVDSDCPQTDICAANLLFCRPAGCSLQNPNCPSGKFCLEGQCVDNDCLNKTCASGTFCRPSDGQCVKPCAGVSCATGEFCKDGACVKDPCASNPCQKGEICDSSDAQNPKCVKDPCQSGTCKHGRICTDGRCLDDPCPLIQCPDNSHRCLVGQCADRQPCQVDLQCSGDQVCLQGRCYPPGCYQTSAACSGTQLCLRAACKNDPCPAAGCAADTFCRRNDGTCAKACATVSCQATERCVDGACVADPCATVSCAAGTVCVAGQCVQEQCNASNVCKFGRVCLASRQICDDDPCAGVTCPDSRQICREGQCVPPPSCVFDKDCPGQQLCLQGKCVNPTCQQNSDCSAGEICQEGRCQKDACQGVQCKPNQFCRAGVCVDTCAGIFCATGEQCVDGVCSPDACAGKTCASDETCVNGKCEKNPCVSDSCKQGRVCRPDGCYPDPCQGLHCPTGQQCQQGRCQGDRPCQNDGECPGPGVCVNQVCRPAGCYQTPCAAGKICKEGQCVDNPCAGKSCAQDEVCRPVDGVCEKRCPACAPGQRCKQGVCENDPCQGVSCNNDERCEEGKCVQDPCVVPNNGLCKYQRFCKNATCSDDPCLAVVCPADHTCRQGVCYGTPVSPENTQEASSETTLETAQEIPQEAENPSAESTDAEVTTEKSETDAGIGDAGTKEGGQTADTGSSDEIGVLGGGCACQQSRAVSLSWLLVLLIFGCGWLWRTRRI